MKSGLLSVKPTGSPNCPSVRILEDEHPMFKCLNNVIRDSLHSKHSTRINPSLCRGLVQALGIEKFREVPLQTLGNNKCRWRCEAELAEENGYNVLKMNLILLSKDSSLTFKLCGARVKEVKEIICWYILISFETFATNLKTGSWKLLSKKFLHCITVLSEEPLWCPGATLTPDKLVNY